MFREHDICEIIEDSIPPAPSADFLQRELPLLSQAPEVYDLEVGHIEASAFQLGAGFNWVWGDIRRTRVWQEVRMLWQDAKLATELQWWLAYICSVAGCTIRFPELAPYSILS